MTLYEEMEKNRNSLRESASTAWLIRKPRYSREQLIVAVRTDGSPVKDTAVSMLIKELGLPDTAFNRQAALEGVRRGMYVYQVVFRRPTCLDDLHGFLIREGDEWQY